MVIKAPDNAALKAWDNIINYFLVFPAKNENFDNIPLKMQI